jgi:hypothetical protein
MKALLLAAMIALATAARVFPGAIPGDGSMAPRRSLLVADDSEFADDATDLGNSDEAVEAATEASHAPPPLPPYPVTFPGAACKTQCPLSPIAPGRSLVRKENETQLTHDSARFYTKLQYEYQVSQSGLPLPPRHPRSVSWEKRARAKRRASCRSFTPPAIPRGKENRNPVDSTSTKVKSQPGRYLPFNSVRLSSQTHELAS